MVSGAAPTLEAVQEALGQWSLILAHLQQFDRPDAAFNASLLAALESRWSGAVRPSTSMFDLHFTLPGEASHRFTQRVHVRYVDSGKVEMGLMADVPRRSLQRPGGRRLVTADFTRPMNALPAVEALLCQLVDPLDLS